MQRKICCFTKFASLNTNFLYLRKTHQMPQVSIITPVYNAEKFLPDTMRSVLGQTFADWEWLITDDRSADRSAEILKSTGDARIKVISSARNIGAGAARNLALAQATGRYITFLDADDYWEPDFLDEMVNFMKTQQATLAYSGYARCDENLQPVLDDFKADCKVNFSNLLKTCRLSLLSSMYDSQAAGIEYFPAGSKREDHVMWLNLLKKIPVGQPLPKTLARYRMHGNSISRKKKNIVKDQYLVYREHMKFSVVKSMYYTINWAVNGYLKYSKMFN